MYLHVSLDTANDTQTVKVEKRGSDGKTVATTSFALKANTAQRIRACKSLNIKPAIVAKIDVSEKQKTQTIALVENFNQPETYYVRNLLSKAETREEFDTFGRALQYAGIADKKTANDAIPVIEWKRIESTCVLDLDFEDEQSQPTTHKLVASVSEMAFAPRWLLTSKSGSVHLIYESDDNISAVEFAAAGLLELQRSYPHAKYELLTRTRTSFTQPRKYTQASTATIQDRLPPLFYERETVSGDFVEWLAERNMRPNGRYPHSFCPVDADNKSGINPPIAVFKHGIKCYKCEANGIRRGSNDPGWFPSRYLMGGLCKPNDLMNMARNFVHFDHAKYEIEKINPTDVGMKALYSALLKAIHGVDDPRIPMVWAPGGRKQIIRRDGYWVDENNDEINVSGNAVLVEQLPFVWDKQHDGSIALNRVRLAWCRETCDLSSYGYSSFRSITGYQFSRFDEEQTRIIKVNPDYLRGKDKFQPRYIDSGKRESFDSCRTTIEKMFPGINFDYLIWCLIARGCSEYNSGQMCITAATGVTGSGKSLHPLIAAAFTGDMPQTYTDQDRNQGFYEAIFANAKRSGYFICDEIFKNYANGDSTVVTNLLQLTPQAGFRLMYVGNVRLGVCPAVFIGETTIPLTVRSNEQIGRRTIHIPLKRAWDIDAIIQRQGFGDILSLRLKCSDEQLNAINGILSWVTDQYFLNGRPDHFGIAESFGFKRLRDNEAVTDKHNLIRQFVDAIRKAPKADGNEAKRFGNGFKLARIGSNDDLWNAFQNIQSEEDKRKGQTECNALDETDIGKVCGLKNSIRIIIKSHGRFIACKLEEMK